MSFFEIFSPGLRHGRRQQDLEKVLVVEDSQGRGPWGRGARIDLDGGHAVLFAPAQPEEAEKTADDEPDPESTNS